MKRQQPKVWVSRDRRGWHWWVTFPNGEVVGCRSFEDAIAFLDVFINHHHTREFVLR